MYAFIFISEVSLVTHVTQVWYRGKPRLADVNGAATPSPVSEPRYIVYIGASVFEQCVGLVVGYTAQRDVQSISHYDV